MERSPLVVHEANLTTIHQPSYQVGQSLVEIGLVASSEQGPGANVVIPQLEVCVGIGVVGAVAETATDMRPDDAGEIEQFN